MTEIDGVDIDFIHVRSKHDHALPLIVARSVSRPKEEHHARIEQ
jgi:hypothetical protein